MIPSLKIFKGRGVEVWIEFDRYVEYKSDPQSTPHFTYNLCVYTWRG